MAIESGRVSNAIGVPIPQWIISQLNKRSEKMREVSRDTENILYQGNKTAFVRLVSSVDVKNPKDQQYFKDLGIPIENEMSLAKNFILQGGISKFNENTKGYDLRQGLSAYNVTNDSEIANYGYRPMPGIQSVRVQTQGQMGSLRSADITIKVWDKTQLDIIDALYFKLGFTMFLEWGHTAYFKSADTKLHWGEEHSVNPFESGLTKEKIFNKIYKNIVESEGNYDAMLGMVTNFTFSYNQEGGYDCNIKLMALGVLASGIKINNPKILPDLQKDIVKKLYNTIIKQVELSRNLQTPQEVIPEPPEKVTILKAIENLKAQDKITKVYAVTPSSPEKITTTTTTIQTGNVTKTTIQYNQQGSGEYSEPDHLVTMKDTGKEFVYLTRIGQVLEYSNRVSYTGYVRQDWLNEFRSNLGGNFLNNLILTPNEKSIYKKEYAIGPLSYKIKYATKAKDPNTGEIGVIEKFIGVEYFPVDFAVSEGTDLLKDAILPALQKSLEGGFKTSIYYSNAQKTFLVDLKTEYSVDGFKTKSADNTEDIVSGKASVATTGVTKQPITKKAAFRIYTDDTFILKDVESNISNNFVERDSYLKNLNKDNVEQVLPPQEPVSEVSLSDIQKSETLKYQSAFEVLIRTIQLYSLDNAINLNNIETSKLVSKLDLTQQKPNPNHYDNFTKKLFSIGLFSNILDDLIQYDANKEKQECEEYDLKINNGLNEQSMLKLRSKYGFNFSLMGNSCTATDLYSKDCRVDFRDLMTTYTVPYTFNSGIFDGTQMNHPVYLKLGFVLMIINHICNIYDNKKDSKSTTPLVYFDFNPNTNICLSNAKQLTTNPYDVLIPFEGTNADFKELFDSSTISDKDIYKPDTEDRLSVSLPKFKLVKGTDKNIYKGKTMNVLLSCDYLLNVVASYVKQDGSNDIYAKEFVEQLLFDVNKYLGDFNTFRLAYDDYGNTMHIVDDQFTPNVEDNYITPTNKTQIPIFGAGSIARSIEIKTEVSTKLANMLAISANSEKNDLSSLSKSSDSFGFYNIGYNDRYILNRGEITSSLTLPTEAMKNSAVQFNQAIKTFYSDTTPSPTSVSHATNYYIEKMSKIKTNEKGSRASAVIPVSLNFSIDGISGLGMGQSFTISDQFLPYTYDLSSRNVYGESDKLNTVGFVAVGLDQSIEGNEWKSNVRANMIFLKKVQDFDVKNLKLIYPSAQSFITTAPPPESRDSDVNIDDFTNYPTVDSSLYPNIKFGSGRLGSPGSEKINDSLLSLINSAAGSAGVVVTVTTGIGGHDYNTQSGNVSRHSTGNAVDISIINNLAAKTNNPEAKKAADKFVDQLVLAGFSRNVESGNPKAVLWNTDGHYNHIHVSYRPSLG
jgi:hypothetical protein